MPISPARTFVSVAALAVAFTLGAGGCHSPGGGWLPMSGGSQTYSSTEMMQKTVTMIDQRTNEVFFSIEIPPGKQLSIDFDKGEGDDPVNTPDLMYYEIMDAGTSCGKLHNSMTVPNATCRLIKVDLRRGVEYAPGKPDRELRTDETADRPAWWTPEGGPMPEDKKTAMYDN